MRYALTFVLLTCLVLPSTANAQLFVSGGLAFPISPDEVNDAYGSGFGATAGFGLDLPLIPITPRVFLGFDSFPIDEDQFAGSIDGGSLRAITLGADALISLPSGPLSPYVAPAAGFTFLSAGDVEVGGVEVELTENETALTLGLGGGLTFGLLVGPEIFLDVRLLYAMTSGDNFLWAPIRVGLML